MQGRQIVIGVSGGVAAYKAAALCSRLVQSGAEVTAVLTESARHFIGEATFAALTGRPVPSHVFDPDHHPLGTHIKLAEQADLVIVAPATANVLAKAATGLADDLLSTLLITVTCPIVLAPAMNSGMWDKPPVQRNVRQLRADGYHIIDPEEGWLSCRRIGIGRMASPETIFSKIEKLLSPDRLV